MYKNPAIQTLCNPLHERMQVVVDVLRLDTMHPVISGNKWFKLKYYLEAAIQLQKKGLLSFGGAYSNHLVALAHCCHDNGLHSLGILRGEEQQNNDSVKQMRAAGMQLRFVSRNAYKNKEQLLQELDISDYIVVPEGGQGPEGVKGAQEILSYVQGNYTHIMCAVGTGTTLTGLIRASVPDQEVIGVPVLKLNNTTNNDIATYIQSCASNTSWKLLYDYHFGGYAKHTTRLLQFMNDFFQREGIPTDFVYTGKLFFAAEDLIQNRFFPAGSKMLLVHTGGLQGNRSLPKGKLSFAEALAD